ncbi:uncharacterized protein [Palaemon carinicauda]|uniref:uncharacterized protein n=1 Tax=Palaemon carinicauda TaxID=392227 RepID=UPI0035B594B8
MACSCSGKGIFITLKVFQIICVIAAIVIYQIKAHVMPIANTYGGIFFCDGSLFMAIVVTPLLLIFGVLGHINGPYFEVAVNLVFGVFLIATGSLTISLYIGARVVEPMVFGSMCIIGAIFYLGDCVRAYQAKKNSTEIVE